MRVSDTLHQRSLSLQLPRILTVRELDGNDTQARVEGFEDRSAPAVPQLLRFDGPALRPPAVERCLQSGAAILSTG